MTPSHFLSLAVLLAACGSSTPTPAPEPAPEEQPPPEADGAEDKALLTRAQALLKPLPSEPMAGENQLTPERIALGKMLYHEARLSIGQDISCNSCHQLDKFGVDGEPTSPGFKGQRGDRNSPTVYNASLHVSQFWDGRAADVEAQAKGPVLNPVEMAMPDEDSVVSVLRSIPGYEAPFKAAFPGAEEPITYDNMASAIGAFERTLLTPSRLDDFLGGDLAALSDAEKKGLGTFLDVGCASCHMGPTLGGHTYMKLGVVKAWETEDVGRFTVTNVETDRFFFKVPSLRNITETGPYLHDGSVATLGEMIRKMGEHQLGMALSEVQVKDIEAFLGALTGAPTPEMLAVPELPPSGPSTPPPVKG